MTDNALAQTITALDLWHLRLPVVSRRDHGIGTVETACEIIVLRLTAEDGTEGWGEAAPWSVFTGSPEASFAALDRYIRPHVIGRALADRARIMEDAARAVAHATEAKAALDTALLDLTGRLLGTPAWALLGGRCRETIPLSVSLANPDWTSDLALLERIADDGVRIVKLKAGIGGHGFDIRRLERIRRDWPDMAVRVDYNQGLAPEDAPNAVADVAAFAPDFIEQPVRADLFDLMARLRAACPVPILADESVYGPEDMTRAIAARICDGVSIKIMKSGSLARAQSTARMARSAGLTAYGGDMFESGLGHLAGAHLIAATPEITLGCEFYQARWYLEEDILEAPFPCSGGQVTVPDGPGLGLRPDPDKLARHTLRRSDPR